ncbi:MAG: hypothetical protein ACLSAP_03815 [Oscillospiraceae bacterium]
MNSMGVQAQVGWYHGLIVAKRLVPISGRAFFILLIHLISHDVSAAPPRTRSGAEKGQ